MNFLTIHKKWLVGALTSKPYSFASRPWELSKSYSIDVYDSMGSNLIIQYKHLNILRILPSINELLNKEWITNKSRFNFDGLNKWRFTFPMEKVNNLFVPKSWKDSLKKISNNIQLLKKKLLFSINGFIDLINNYSAKLLFTFLGTNQYLFSGKYLTYLNDLEKNNLFFEFNYNSLQQNIKNKIYIIIGSNLKLEQPLFNIFLNQIKNNKVYIIGPYYNLYNNNFFNIKNNILVFYNFIRGKFNIYNYEYKKINIIFGLNNLLTYYLKDFKNILKSLPFSFKLNILFTNLSQSTTVFNNSHNKVKFNNVGIYNKNKFKKIVNHYILEDYNYDYIHQNLHRNTYTIFQGTHITGPLLNKINYLLPTTNIYEMNNYFINNLGILQKSKKFLRNLTMARPHWQIFKAISEKINNNSINKYLIDILIIKNFSNIINFLNKRLIILDNLKNITFYYKLKYNFFNTFINTNIHIFKIYNSNLENVNNNYYNQDYVSKVSKNMILCNTQFIKNNLNFYDK